MMSQAERNMIHVITFGTARIISNREAGSATNYINRDDWIPWLADHGRCSDSNPDVAFLPGKDHTFFNPQYQEALSSEGDDFVKTYGVIS